MPRLVPLLLAGGALAACTPTTLIVENAAGCPLTVEYVIKGGRPATPERTVTKKVTDKDGKKVKKKVTQKARKAIPPQVERHVIEPGKSAQFTKIAPSPVKSEDSLSFNVSGDCYAGIAETRVTVGEPNTWSIEANAGTVALTNTGGADLAEVYAADIKTGGMVAAMAHKDWGPNRGPVKAGETRTLGGFLPTDTLWVKGGGNITGPFKIEVGGKTAAKLEPKAGADEANKDGSGK